MELSVPMFSLAMCAVSVPFGLFHKSVVMTIV